MGGKTIVDFDLFYCSVVTETMQGHSKSQNVILLPSADLLHTRMISKHTSLASK